MRRLNAHHFSCWHSPRCHQRMYVMDLPPAEEGGRKWARRVPTLRRVDDVTRTGAHKFASLGEAWERALSLLRCEADAPRAEV